jgi:glycosyltransferase involved in cell wall biosynthesis
VKIAFVWDWEPTHEQTVTWKDGLAAALKELIRRGHEVEVYADTDRMIEHPWFDIWPAHNLLRASYQPDVILHWADMTRPHAVEHAKLGVPMAICFAGGEALGENYELFDHIFVESEVYREKFEQANCSVSIAFGTNTDLFTPESRQQKVFDVLFPATYAKWKRHDLLASATKDLRVCTAGYMYPGTWESDCYEVMQDSGALVLPHVSAEALRALYAASKCVVVPSRSDGGSQRTVLEALAMNIPTIVCDSDKFDYPGTIRCEPNEHSMREAIDWAINRELPEMRPAILADWSHITYADAIEKELLRLCQASQS